MDNWENHVSAGVWLYIQYSEDLIYFKKQTRYLGAFFLTYLLASSTKIRWEDIFGIFKEQDVPKFFQSCFNGRLFTGLGSMIVLLAEVILVIRVYALFGRSKQAFVASVILLTALLAFNILQLTPVLDSWETGSPTSGYNGVTLSDPSSCISALPMSGIAWAVTSTVELLLFLLVIWKAFQHRKMIASVCNLTSSQQPNQDIAAILAKDSIFYFAIIFSICLLGTILVFVLEYSKLFIDFTKMLCHIE
ncbi:uncharacterized protein FOMMEDRAFT_27392 [Fomitiporia mediterranea MF3/22]|uniref:uncharacterized protein n=1 Tax=Fomitiporia mediterranea (strain MF3/22) TaxID=694068 RepID=UPI0004407E6C|nr:uncharacterized protein FOMMEDRAFT_27392 [Fomitiporia mediterranea MF3/22]EJD05209.1 hypothetical protein FOMMEDRAFT_27392 [Fomitiporia mediterranea MF3/22]